MKKILIGILILFIISTIVPIPIAADDTYQGINYINPSIFNVAVTSDELSSTTQLEVENTTSFPITPGIEYFLLPMYLNYSDGGIEWENLPQFQSTVTPRLNLVDLDDVCSEVVPLTKPLYSNDVLVGYAFEVPYDIEEIRFIDLQMASATMTTNQFLQFYDTTCVEADGLLMLIKADNLKYLLDDHQFDYDAVRGAAQYDVSLLHFGDDMRFYTYGVGLWDTISPIIEGNTYTYFTPIDNPIALENLQEAIGLQAYDDVDGNLTEAIEIIDDGNYPLLVGDVVPVENRQLGTYPIVFSVTDAADNTSTCTIYIEVEDTVLPSLNLMQSTLQYTLNVDSAVLSAEQIKAAITVTDNHKIASITEQLNTYTGHEKELGSHLLIFRYSDEAGNYINVEITVLVEDTTAPVIASGTDFIELSYQDNYTLLEILAQFQITVTDNYLETISYDIVSEQYSSNIGYVGTYQIVIKAVDSADNEVQKTLTVFINDEVPPAFYLDSQYVVIEVGTSITNKDIIRILRTKGLLKDEVVTIEIIEDQYSAHCNETGEYEMKVRVNYKNSQNEIHHLIFRVINPVQPKLTFFQQILQFMKKIFLWVWNILKWPIDQIIRLF